MIHSRYRLRNLAIAALVVALVLVFTTQQTPLPASAQAQATLSIDVPAPAVNPGSVAETTLSLTNASDSDHIFNISVDNLPRGFISANPGAIQVNDGATQAFKLDISVATTVEPGTYTGMRVAAKAQDDSDISTETFITIIVSGATFTPTPGNTSTPTRTPTTAPTTTICADGFEPDDERGDAKVIDVNAPQRRTICGPGDEDWLFFGGIAGKVYTIDVAEMVGGLDLSLELFDSSGRSLAFNDDFFDRIPPNPNDNRPRIQSFQIPVDGHYYIRVRDTAQRGGVDFFYEIALLSESYGPTPTTVTELCLDLFEPDGLPEQARLITSNEIQEDRRLCPSGDADWVVFFAKAGKRYALFTDTRRYRGPNDVYRDRQAGADTVLLLTDRDGVSPLDSNDDISGGDTLDSQIDFFPEVDGFYYAQVKNIGDIGNQFVRYDLVLQLCNFDDADCGRLGGAKNRSTPISGASPFAPSATPIEQFGTPTSTPEPTPTETAAVLNQNNDQAGAADGAFADIAFRQLWQRSDLPIAVGRITRSWMWGSNGWATRNEAYQQAASGKRLVQYFDKGRMELNIADDDRAEFVTSGLLAHELISGRMQIGANEFIDWRAASDIVIAGDSDDPNAPTYASFTQLIDETFASRIGVDVRERLRRDGTISAYRVPVRAEARLVRYIPETGHNIPAIFWQFLNARGEIYNQGRYITGPLVDWVATMGFPISEPYWVRVRIDGAYRDVLVQAFERRVLTYDPANPIGWQVEMGNVGRHYYLWRYDEALP